LQELKRYLIYIPSYAETNAFAQATGDVLVFLDSHMEVTKNWIEPLLEYVRDNRRGVAAAIIDVMEADGKYLSNGDISIVTLWHRFLEFVWYIHHLLLMQEFKH